MISLQALSKYFFAYTYLAQMFALKEKDEEPWNFWNDGNFFANISSIPYTELGADHALKQANKSMKTHGGIKGIVNNQLA